MDNGSIGEAKTKAFLIDRFWILERSVDINGADFIIQRKIFGTDLLDKIPPRFGFIQAKFSQNINTHHTIKKEYLLDNDNKTHEEFFVIINIDFENSHKLCVLSADDILKNCSLDKKGNYVLKTRFAISNFICNNSKTALDRIENGIKSAEFYKNRLFLKGLISEKPDLKNIDFRYISSLDDPIEGISQSFFVLKERAYKTVLDIEKLHSNLIEYIKELDPIKAMLIAEKIEHFSGHISIPEIFDPNLYYNARKFLEKKQNLINDNILQSYLDLWNDIEKEIESFITNNREYFLNKNFFHCIIVYDKATLKILSITKNFLNSNKVKRNDYFFFNQSTEGHIEFTFRAVDLKLNSILLDEILEKVYELKYYDQ